MKFTGLKENFSKALNIAQRIIIKNPSLPILENILIETEDKRLKISATNLEMGVHLWIKGKVEEEGKICIPSSLFVSIINNSKEERITLESQGVNVKISAQSFEGIIKGQDSNEFPLIPKPDIEPFISLGVRQVAEGLSQVQYIATISEMYPEISGVSWSFSKDALILMATDSFRLGKKEIPLAIPKEFHEKTPILPLKSSQELGYILEQSAQATFQMGVSENQALFLFDDIRIVSRLLAGNYPNSEDLIPKEFTTDVTVDRLDFIDNIKLISVFAPKTNDCKLEVVKEGLTISSNATLGSSQARLKATVKGASTQAIVFNYRYLLEGLLHIKTKEITFHIKNEATPVIFQGVGDDNFVYLVAPLKS